MLPSPEVLVCTVFDSQTTLKTSEENKTSLKTSEDNKTTLKTSVDEGRTTLKTSLMDLIGQTEDVDMGHPLTNRSQKLSLETLLR